MPIGRIHNCVRRKSLSGVRRIQVRKRSRRALKKVGDNDSGYDPSVSPAHLRALTKNRRWKFIAISSRT